jgi:hypothetical protein
MPPSKRKQKAKTAYRPPSPPKWRGRDSLELVYQLNERALQLLSTAINRNTGVRPTSFPQREAWVALSPQAIARASRFPFVIVDIRFTDERWWRSVVANRQEPRPGDSTNERWPQEVTVPLVSEVLVFAWHTAKWDPRIARLTFGMLPGVVEVIAALTPQQLANIPIQHSETLVLRWQADPDFWPGLLAAARDGDEEALADYHLHGKLLLSGALLSTHLPRESRDASDL